MKRFFFQLLLIAFSLNLGLLGAEGLLRTGLIPNPHHDRMQHDGETANPAARFLVLGDSFVMRNGFDFYKLLAAELTARRISVLNPSLAGFGPIQYASEYQTYAPGFKPDVTLLFLYMGNDLTEVQNAPDMANTPSSRFKARYRALVRRSYLYHFYLYKRYSLFPHKTLPGEGKINPYLIEQGQRRPHELLDNLLMEQPKNRQAFQIAKEKLQVIIDGNQRRRARLFVVIFPHTTQVNASHFSFFKTLGIQTDPRTLSAEGPQKEWADFFIKQNIPVLNLLPAFRARREKEWFLDRDDHLNVEGSRLAYDHVRRFLNDVYFNSRS